MKLQDSYYQETQKESGLDRSRVRAAIWAGIVILILGGISAMLWPLREGQALLHVTFEASAPFFTAVDKAYSPLHGLPSTALRVSSAGSVEKAQAVAQGFVADTICLATPAEMDETLRKVGFVDEEWRGNYPHGSSPFYSTIVLLVRKDNPRGISGWDDLYRPDLSVAVSSPRIGGAGCYTYLALLSHEITANKLTEAAPSTRVQDLYLRARILDFSSRQAFAYFAREQSIDVFPTWESEGLRVQREQPGDFEVIYPAASILAEPVVAMLGKHARRRDTVEQADQFIRFLFSEEGQAIVAEHGFRPRLEGTGMKATFPSINMLSVEEVFGNWEDAWQSHFGHGGSYEMIESLRSARRGGAE